jgi:hypothetical protein
LAVDLNGCEPWSLTLREEHGLEVFENRMLRRIFELKRNEIIGGWRKLHSEKLHNLCFSPNINRVIKSRKIRWAEHVALMAGKRNAYWSLVGKQEGERPLRRPRHSWEYNIKMDLRKKMG